MSEKRDSKSKLRSLRAFSHEAVTMMDSESVHGKVRHSVGGVDRSDVKARRASTVVR